MSIESIVSEVRNFHSTKTQLNEESTKMYLILSLFEYLGWNYRSYSEVRAEYVSDDRNNGAEKVDYAIMKDGKPFIFVECKSLDTDLRVHIGQLARYYSATLDVRYGILTDGNKWLFFGDFKNSNVMDKEPFYSICVEDIDEKGIEFLDIFKKENFENIPSDIKKFILRDFMNRLLNGENEEFLFWVSDKLNFDVNSKDIKFAVNKKVGLFTEKICENVNEDMESYKYSFNVFGQNFYAKSNGEVLTQILNYLIDNDEDAINKVVSWPIFEYFTLITDKRTSCKIPEKWRKHYLKDGSYYVYNMSTEHTQKVVEKIIKESKLPNNTIVFMDNSLKIKCKVFNKEFIAVYLRSIISDILDYIIKMDKEAFERIKNWNPSDSFYIHINGRDESLYEKKCSSKKYFNNRKDYFRYSRENWNAKEILERIVQESTLPNNVIEWL